VSHIAAAAAAAAEAEAAEKAEAERLAAEKEKEKKKKPVRYPTEDLDVKLTDRELKAGALLKRPLPGRDTLSFSSDQQIFEVCLMTWNFLVTYGFAISFPVC
jgi:bromodomain adjacent to zinc finger domain protein 1A